jgi:virginiamycin B lyase
MFFFSSALRAATASGTVKGPANAPFAGAFIQAQNIKTKVMVSVLSDTQGRYRIENLPAGDYLIKIRAVGYIADPREGVQLATSQSASFNFALRQGLVRWSDISIYQGQQLFPAGRGKDLVQFYCSTCHAFQTRMASVTRDADGWKDRVQYMRTAMHFNMVYRMTDQDAADVSAYLTSLFGPESVLPKSPADMPGYKNTVRPFGSDSQNIVYVEYEMPGPSRMPFSAAPGKDGYVWIPNFGAANKISRLDPKTGEMQDFPVPAVGTAAIHSAVPAPDGSVWLAEQGTNRLGKWDPTTQKITEFQDEYIPGKEGVADGGQKHTVRIDPSGNVWSSGSPLTKFDPETKKFTRFEQIKIAYDVKIDKSGDAWFTAQGLNSIGKVDAKTMKVSTWVMPTKKSFPRRLEIGPDGMVYVGEYDAGKIARFDPKTETFKEYPLPGADPTPYGMGFDGDGFLWYNSHEMDELGRFDTKTGKIIEYPFPQSEIAMREFFPDSQGRLWFGSSPNNKVGYFYLAKDSGASGK